MQSNHPRGLYGHTVEQGGALPSVDTRPLQGEPNTLHNCPHTPRRPVVETSERPGAVLPGNAGGPAVTRRGVSHQKTDVTHMLVLAVDVSHSPARPMMSRPEDSWLKNRG